MLGIDLPPKTILKRAVIYFFVILAFAAVFAVLYSIVYVRCYNITNPDDMIAFKLIRNGEDIFVILFNKLYKLC
ncbi:MAG: hypothetical protein IJ446_04990 [Oscillospiraceae bacterium]|nr:hypothetical protein [Oscillospiraceae bacterium]